MAATPCSTRRVDSARVAAPCVALICILPPGKRGVGSTLNHVLPKTPGIFQRHRACPSRICTSEYSVFYSFVVSLFFLLNTVQISKLGMERYKIYMCKYSEEFFVLSDLILKAL